MNRRRLLAVAHAHSCLPCNLLKGAPDDVFDSVQVGVPHSLQPHREGGLTCAVVMAVK